MAKKPTSNRPTRARPGKAQPDKGYVRTEDAPVLPPPPSEAGISGWLWHNVLASCSDFTSIGSAVRSIVMAFFTVFVGWLTISTAWGLFDFAVLSAVWSDPDGIKREACFTIDQGGRYSCRQQGPD